jgi:hypothetical protein
MSDTIAEAPLRRLHRALVQALRERDPAGLGRPFTVAEIYQDLVPYRTHRDVLGVEMNGDYEHLVLRLLAGEEDLLTLGSEHARGEIQAELGRSNPNTGLYREYAGVDVHLVAEHIPPEEDDGAIILPRDEAVVETVVELDLATSVDDLAPAPLDEEDDMIEATEEAEEAGEAEEAVLPGDDGVCFWCRGQLPIRETLNFCPFCGTDVAVMPCGACGEALEVGWRFCIQCGATSGEG